VYPVALSFVLFLIVWEVLVIAEPLVRGSAARIAKLTAKLRYRDYLPVIVLLLIGGGIAAFVGDQFVDLAELVLGKSPMLQTIDQTVHDFVLSMRSPGATRFFVAMSIVGGPVVLGIVTGLLAGALAIRKRYAWAIYLIVTAGGGALLNMELKRYFQRARPDLAEMIRRASGYSFPSGHALGSTVVAGALAYLAMRLIHAWRLKAAVIAFAVTFVVAVATSRVYLGVHWLSDITAGVSGGVLWLVTTTLGYETFRRVQSIRASRAKQVTTLSSP
jgi:membrane-associated phospholipid phosphatase